MKISIITVCLNSERTIEQTIQSVIHQDDGDYEYIIIDGNSTDRTLEIISKYNDEVSLVVSEADGGIYDAMNKGIALSTGDVIGIINSDDWYEPGAFQEVRKCFQDSHTEAVYGNLHLIYKNGQIETSIPDDISNMRCQMEIPHPTVFIRREAYEKYGAFDKTYQIAADYELMLRLYVNGVNFRYMNMALANFRFGGISSKKEEAALKEALIIARRYLPYAPLPERRKYREIISRRWKAFHFTKMIDSFPHALVEILTEKLGVKFDDGIAVFGAGRWGGQVHKILQQRDINPSFIVDNDLEKWGKSIDGIQVSPPCSLKSFHGVLLAAVNGFSTEILRQIGEMGNAALDCITWEEIADEFMEKEFLSMEY